MGAGRTGGAADDRGGRGEEESTGKGWASSSFPCKPNTVLKKKLSLLIEKIAFLWLPCWGPAADKRASEGQGAVGRGREAAPQMAGRKRGWLPRSGGASLAPAGMRGPAGRPRAVTASPRGFDTGPGTRLQLPQPRVTPAKLLSHQSRRWHRGPPSGPNEDPGISTRNAARRVGCMSPRHRRCGDSARLPSTARREAGSPLAPAGSPSRKPGPGRLDLIIFQEEQKSGFLFETCF